MLVAYLTDTEFFKSNPDRNYRIRRATKSDASDMGYIAQTYAAFMVLIERKPRGLIKWYFNKGFRRLKDDSDAEGEYLRRALIAECKQVESIGPDSFRCY